MARNKKKVEEPKPEIVYGPVPQHDHSAILAELIRFFPFLRNGKSYRKITKQEIRNEDTYRELFPDGQCICDGSLLALWKWQKYTDEHEG
jgi:hypothetical protein